MAFWEALEPSELSASEEYKTGTSSSLEVLCSSPTRYYDQSSPKQDTTDTHQIHQIQYQVPNIYTAIKMQLLTFVPTFLLCALAAASPVQTTRSDSPAYECNKICIATQMCVVLPENGEEVCVDPAMCGGYAGIKCEEGLRCLDNPYDDCDPANGGADCAGVCAPYVPFDE